MSPLSSPKHPTQDVRECKAHPQGSKVLLSLQESACAMVWGGTSRVSQDETGLERLVVSGTKSGAGNRLVEEVYFVCYLEVLSGKVAGALYTHSHTHTVSRLTGRGNALHFPASCPQAKPKCQP